MLIKKIIERLCHVTFVMQPEMDVRGVWVCGDFNGWDESSCPMERCKDGSFERTIPLQTGQSYRFRYRLANGEWENDWGADDYTSNPYGGRDSVVNTD